MSNDYGAEVRSILDRLIGREQDEAQADRSYGAFIGTVVEMVLAEGVKVLYFPPGRYVFQGPPPDPMVPDDMVVAREYIVPEDVQFFFAVNAILRVEKHAILRVRGSIRAGKHQIFGFDRGEVARFSMPGGPLADHPEVVTWPLYPYAGKVVIESNTIPLVRPEWWGALLFNSTSEVVGDPARSLVNYDSSDAFRGAIEAACTGRAGRSPIPIALGGMYQCASTLEVTAPPDADGKPTAVCLVLRGTAGIGSGAAAQPSIVRNFRRDDPKEPIQALLRLSPGVSYDIQDVFIDAADGIQGCVEVICASNEPGARRGLLRRVTLRSREEFQLRIVHDGAASTSPVSRAESKRRRHFVVDSCAMQDAAGIPTRNAIQLDGPESMMLHVNALVLYTAPIDNIPAPPRDSKTEEQSRVILEQIEAAVAPIVVRAGYHATLHLTGASALMEGCVTQENSLPRPSRVAPDLNDPDGQDVFLAAPPVGSMRPSTHFTAVQIESQSWWFLCRAARTPTAPARRVVLLGVSHENANRGNPSILAVAWAWGFQLGAPIGSPPSVVWLGTAGRCVLIGCQLFASVFLHDPATVIDVGTAFTTDATGADRKLFLSSVSQLSQRYERDRMSVRRSYEMVPLGQPLPSGHVTWDDNVAHLVPVVQEPGETGR